MKRRVVSRQQYLELEQEIHNIESVARKLNKDSASYAYLHNIIRKRRTFLQTLDVED